MWHTEGIQKRDDVKKMQRKISITYEKIKA